MKLQKIFFKFIFFFLSSEAIDLFKDVCVKFDGFVDRNVHLFVKKSIFGKEKTFLNISFYSGRCRKNRFIVAMKCYKHFGGVTYGPSKIGFYVSQHTVCVDTTAYTLES